MGLGSGAGGGGRAARAHSRECTSRLRVGMRVRTVAWLGQTMPNWSRWWTYGSITLCDIHHLGWDQRSITWTQQSNRPTEPGVPHAPSPPCPRTPRPPDRLTPHRLPGPTCPAWPPITHPFNLVPPALTPPPPPSRPIDPVPPTWPHSTASSIICLPRWWAPLPAPPRAAPLSVSAPASSTQRLYRRCPCLLRPCASQNDWGNHKMAEQNTKWLTAISKSNEYLSKILRMTDESHKITEKIIKWLSKS
jgi:hypothetical protein